MEFEMQSPAHLYVGLLKQRPRCHNKIRSRVTASQLVSATLEFATTLTVLV